MPKFVVDTLSLLGTKIAKNQPLNCAAAAEPNEVIAPNVRELLIDREHDVAGFVIPLTLEEVSPWHIRLRHGGQSITVLTTVPPKLCAMGSAKINPRT